MNTEEQRFFDALKNIFIGAPVEGESGYINLMRIKARYFEKVMMPHLQREIDEAVKPFPDFWEELFDKLYTFFRRYFTESGSIGFFFTPYHQSVYEQVYTDDQDVMLFWKTARLYYVKTDRLFRSMTVEVDGFRFFFDVSTLEHKKANEKRDLVFTFKEQRGDGVFVFTVAYSEKGKQTRLDEIRRAIRDALGLSRYTDAVPSEETLERAFRLFERQSEVDYFICKDARSFLREQFDLWMWQYLLGKPGEEPTTEWTEERLKQLQALKRIAYRVIDFIAAFEDELVKIWNKPKFVLRSGYVITLDRIYERSPELIERITEHSCFAQQVKEWQELGMVEESFTAQALWETNLTEGRHLHLRYRFLPLDTRYFKDLELEILSLFDNLDEALDGWLIKSENYQALKTMLPKFRGKVKCIYIDPPYNTGNDGFLYRDTYQHSSWLSMMYDRLALAREWMREDGAIFISIDDNEAPRLRAISDNLWEPIGFFVWEKKKKGSHLSPTFRDLTEYVFAYAKHVPTLGRLYGEQAYAGKFQPLIKRSNALRELQFPAAKIEASEGSASYQPGTYGQGEMAIELLDPIKVVNGLVQNAFRMRGRFIWTQETLERELQAGSIIRLSRNLRPNVLRAGQDEKTKTPPSLVSKEIAAYEDAFNEITNLFGQTGVYGYPKPVGLIRFFLNAVTYFKPEGLVLDFFAGSGTTGHAVINLNREDGGRRKFILVEMAQYFDTVLLPRIKKVVFSDKWRDGKAQPDGQGISHFVKYYELEQYEDTLRRTRYLDDDLFTPPETEDPCQYLFLRDPKMLNNAETGEPVVVVNLGQGTVKVDLSKLYPDIDLAETLSNLTGKWIKRISSDQVEFADGTTADLKNPDWRQIKPLIWW